MKVWLVLRKYCESGRTYLRNQSQIQIAFIHGIFEELVSILHEGERFPKRFVCAAFEILLNDLAVVEIEHIFENVFYLSSIVVDIVEFLS